MKGNFLLFASLLAGVLVGMSGATPHWLLNAQLPMILLELLIVQVGMGIGSMEHLDRLFAGFRWEMLLLPAFTIVGTASVHGLRRIPLPRPVVRRFPRRGQRFRLLFAVVGAHQSD